MAKTRILIVEDEVLIAEDLKYCLTGLGYDVLKSVESGKMALETIKSESIDLVLMDILLQEDMNGIETAQIIKEKYNIPFIYMTSHSDQATLEAAKQTEPLGYILKPFSENELHGTIELALHKHQMNLKYQESLNQFKYIYENAPIGIYRTTPDGEILMANPKLLEMLCFNSLEELKKINLEEKGFHPKYPRSELKKQIELEGGVRGWEGVWNRKDGTYLYIRENAIGIKDHHGKVIYYEGTVEDITDKKRLEEKLKLDEQKFRVISELSTDFSLIVDVDENNKMTCNNVTDSFTDITGLERNDISDFDKFLKYVHPDDFDSLRNDGLKLLKNHEISLLVRYKGKDTDWCWIQFEMRPIWDEDEKRIIRIVGAGHDLTHEKLVEDRLRESEERYRDIVEKAHLGIIIFNVKGRIIYSNRQAPELFGYSLEEAKNLNMNDWMHPDDIEMVKSYHKKRIKGEQVPSQYEFRGIKQNGDIIYLEVKDGLFKKNNVNLGVRTYLWDITARKNAELQMEESEARFRMLYEGVPIGYQSLDVDGKIVEVNQKWCKTLGYSKRDVLGQKFKTFIAKECFEKFDMFFRELKEKGYIENIELELLHKNKSKTPVIVSFNGSVTYDVNQNVVECHCVFTDITERYKVEKELHESDERYRKLISESKDGICIVQIENNLSDAVWIEVNDSYCKLLEYSREELLKISPINAVSIIDRNNLAGIEEELFNRKSIIFKTNLKTKSKKQIPVEINTHIVDYKGNLAVVGIVRDLRQRLEQAD